MPYPHVVDVVPVTPGGPSVAGTSLLDLCCRVADTVGFRLPTVVTETASAGDTARVVLADELRDDEQGATLAAGSWLYVASGTQAQTQRRIVREPEAGYLGSQGGLTLSRPVPAALEAGSVIHATSPLPMRRHLGVPGYREAINQGLALIWTQARLTLAGNGTHAYDLAPFAGYLQRGELQIVGVRDDGALGADGPHGRTPGHFEVVTSGVDRTLVVPRRYGESETFSLDVLVRADRLIHDGSAWTFIESGALGLTDDAHQCACPGDWAYVFGCWKAYTALARYLEIVAPGSPEDRAAAAATTAQERASWAAGARGIKTHEMARPEAPPARPPVSVVSSAWA